MATYKHKDSDERRITVDGSRLDKMLASDDRYTKLTDKQAEATAEKVEKADK